jgi:YVTN family beta-propeller protein
MRASCSRTRGAAANSSRARAPGVSWLRRLARDRVSLAALAGVALLLGALLVMPALEGRAAPAHPPPADPPLIVADLRGHALAVVDPRDGTTARRIELPGGPHELVHLADGRVAVTLEQYGRLALVDLSTGAVEAHEVGGFPHGVDERDGVLYVTDRSLDAVRRFDLDGWAEVTSLPAGAWPHAVRIIEGGAAVTANAKDDTIRIGETILAASVLPETVAIAPGGDRIATAGAYGGDVEVFRVDGTLVERWTVGGRPVRVEYGADGTLAVALSAAGAVALIDDRGPRFVAVGGVPDGLVFSPDARRLYVGDVHGGVVSVIDVASGEVVRTILAGSSAGALLFTR